MAASFTRHALFATPLSRVHLTTYKPSPKCFLPSKRVPSLPQKAKMQVRCNAEKEDTEGKDESLWTRLAPPPLETVSPDFMDVFAFAGPGPERINGRLAMIGFVSAIVAEFVTGQDLFMQISNGGYTSFVSISSLLTVASLIPLFEGVGPGAKSNKFWNPNAEIWNGRVAMVGLVALAIIEFFKGGPLLEIP